MALEAVVFPQNPLVCNLKELHVLAAEEEEKEDVLMALYRNLDQAFSFNSAKLGFDQKWRANSMNASVKREELGRAEEEKEAEEDEEEEEEEIEEEEEEEENVRGSKGRKKRRRRRALKNKEEVESQRMTHIAVERNRRKQMNHYLALLRSLMPPSYVQRGDQASIISGAINFVKEMEQFHQFLQVQKQLSLQNRTETKGTSNPLSSFLSSPQYSSPASAASIEVGMVESHANLKLLLHRRPKQLLTLIMGLQNLRLTTLHLNVTSVDSMVLYSFTLKVEDDCALSSVDEIAAVVHEIVMRISQEDLILLR